MQHVTRKRMPTTNAPQSRASHGPMADCSQGRVEMRLFGGDATKPTKSEKHTRHEPADSPQTLGPSRRRSEREAAPRPQACQLQRIDPEKWILNLASDPRQCMADDWPQTEHAVPKRPAIMATPEHPNVLLIMSDEHAPQYSTVYGHPVVVRPQPASSQLQLAC